MADLAFHFGHHIPERRERDDHLGGHEARAKPFDNHHLETVVPLVVSDLVREELRLTGLEQVGEDVVDTLAVLLPEGKSHDVGRREEDPLPDGVTGVHPQRYNMSIAVWVGIIALAGLDAETGVVMLLYLELAYDKWKKEGKLTGIADLKDAIMFGAVKRIRPKIMTVGVILAGLIPVMFSHGAGSDVMKRIAAPMVGGVITSTILELIIYPAIYMLWKGRELKSGDTD